MWRTCPSCRKEIRVFHVRDVEGGWFIKHKNTAGVECEMSLYTYPRLTKRAPDAGDSAASASILQDSECVTRPSAGNASRSAALCKGEKMLHPIDVIEVLDMMRNLDTIHDKNASRKWHELWRWLNDKAAEQKMHPTLGESAASDSESTPAPKRVI